MPTKGGGYLVRSPREPTIQITSVASILKGFFQVEHDPITRFSIEQMLDRVIDLGDWIMLRLWRNRVASAEVKHQLGRDRRAIGRTRKAFLPKNDWECSHGYWLRYCADDVKTAVGPQRRNHQR